MSDHFSVGEGKYSITPPAPRTFEFQNQDGKMLVSISCVDGKVTLGEGVTPDEAAKQFWASVEMFFPRERLKP